MTLREIATRNGEAPPPETPELPTLEQFKGCILGCALGDVVGAWAERRPAAEARDFAEHFVRPCDFSKTGKHHHGMSFGQYTDDTQLTRELMLSLLDQGEWVPEDFADRIANIFARDAIVGYGGATQEAAVRLLDGVSWDSSGTPPPRAGNGAAMRAGPMGLFFWDDVDALVASTMEQASITHKAPMSVAASVAVAGAVAMCLNASRATSGPHEPGWWQWLARFVERCDEEYANDIRDLADMVFTSRKMGTPEAQEREAIAKWVLKDDDPRWSGVSPWARPSVLWSLYCLMASPKDVWGAIEIAVWVGGDSDTIAAMAGAMVGAHIGIDKFPQKPMEEVVPVIHDIKADQYDWAGLERIVEHFYGVVERRHGENTKVQTLPVKDRGQADVPEEPVEGAEANILDMFRRE